MSMAEKVIPALDLAELISIPGSEAYGATNIKMMMNGVVTLGSHDGINELISKAVGPSSICMFGSDEHE